MASNPRLTALNNLANQLPIANGKVQKQQQAARDMQLQQAVKAAPVGAATTPVAQQGGAAVTAQQGEQQVSSAQNLIKQQGQIGNIALQEQQDVFQQGQASSRMGARESAMNNVQRLAALDERAKSELYDKQMKFEKDEAGRTLFNETQLQDYIRTSSISDEQAANRQQMLKQASDRKLQLMRRAHEVASEDLTQKYLVAKQQGDQQTAMEVYRIKKAMDDRIKEQERDAANRTAAWGAGGQIVGTVAGAVVGGPSGAAAGGSMGRGMGSAAGSSQSGNTNTRNA